MAHIIQVDDPLDPRLEHYREVRERDLVGRRGVFVAEGRVVLDVLVDSPGFAIESVLVLRNKLAGVGAILERLPAGTPVYVASVDAMDRIAGFHVHRGMLAIGRKADVRSASALVAADGPRAVLVLVGLANHDNVGAIFRNAAAFGADAILLDATCCDPLYRKAIRVSTGSVFRVPFARFEDPQALPDLLAEAGYVSFGLSPAGEESIVDVDPPPRLALHLGAEGPGLPDVLMQRIRTLRIPMRSGVDSLNVATAAAIALHRLSRPPAS
jgi:tRNA G18 (ribose-2'-O)-methylase SpoU